jgi:hypothetical protein
LDRSAASLCGASILALGTGGGGDPAGVLDRGTGGGGVFHQGPGEHAAWKNSAVTFAILAPLRDFKDAARPTEGLSTGARTPGVRPFQNCSRSTAGAMHAAAWAPARDLSGA